MESCSPFFLKLLQEGVPTHQEVCSLGWHIVLQSQARLAYDVCDEFGWQWRTEGAYTYVWVVCLTLHNASTCVDTWACVVGGHEIPGATPRVTPRAAGSRRHEKAPLVYTPWAHAPSLVLSAPLEEECRPRAPLALDNGCPCSFDRLESREFNVRHCIDPASPLYFLVHWNQYGFDIGGISIRRFWIFACTLLSQIISRLIFLS